MAWLQRNSRGDSVRDVQGLLWQAGVYDGAIDGVYGEKTQAAVEDWQSFLGIKDDGKWGAQTIKATSNKLAEINMSNPNLKNNMPVIPLAVKKRGM